MWGGGYSYHLRQVLQENYEILEDWKGENITGIDPEWKYSPTHNDHTFCLSVKGYIEIILIQFGHNLPTKSQL